MSERETQKTHKEDVTKNTGRVTTRAKRKESVDTMHASALTDHVAQQN